MEGKVHLVGRMNVSNLVPKALDTLGGLEGKGLVLAEYPCFRCIVDGGGDVGIQILPLFQNMIESQLSYL